MIETFVRFYDVEGAGGTVYSRLLSLRRELWDQGDDGVIQMIGFKLGKFSVVFEIGISHRISIIHYSIYLLSRSSNVNWIRDGFTV